MPPFAVPSSFVSTMPVTSTASRKSIAWRSPFWPGGGVDGQQGLVRRAGHAARDHLADLAQLVHQVLLGVQAAGGVDDHHVVPPRLGRLDGVVGHGARIRARVARARARSRRARPTRRAARRRPRGRCRRRPAAPSGPAPGCRCQAILPIVVVLPLPLTPDHEDHRGLRRQRRWCPLEPSGLGQQLAQAPGQVLAAAAAPRARPRPPAARRSARWSARPRRRRSASPPGARRPPRRATGTSWPAARRPAPGGSSTCSPAGGGRSRRARSLVLRSRPPARAPRRWRRAPASCAPWRGEDRRCAARRRRPRLPRRRSRSRASLRETTRDTPSPPMLTP